MGYSIRFTLHQSYNVFLNLIAVNHYLALVKAFCIMFAVLFGFLTGYPCSDDETCEDDKNIGLEVNISNHEHSSDEIDLCSPLCICSCCSSQINQPAHFYFHVYSPHYAAENVAYINSFVKNVYQSIWQPPKLV